MCQCIRKYHEITGRKVGFKAAGGISSAMDAVGYYSIVSTVLGKAWLGKDLFRNDRKQHESNQKKGYVLPLRKGWYAFADLLAEPDYARYFASKLCAPSYISLHAALSFYGIIPEAVLEITSVTTRKTCRYDNNFGQYSYQTVLPILYWGFEPKQMRDGKQYMVATPEKALIDLLYLYPQYKTIDELKELRLDEDWLHDELNLSRLEDFSTRTGSRAVADRLKVLIKAYDL